MKNKISIIIPTYNCPFIERSVDSVIEQTFKDWEIIIIDNYSKNKVKEIIRKKNDPRIRHFKFRNNGVIGKSRNYGIRKARFNWVAFLDSDDYWTKDKLLKITKKIKKNKYDFFYHNMFVKKQKHSFFKKKLYKYYFENMRMYDDLIVNGNSIIQSSVVVKKDLIKNVGYISEKKNFIAWEDYDLWLKISKISNKFCFIKDCLGYYYVSKEDKKLIRFIKNISQFKKNYKKQINEIKTKYKLKNLWWIKYSEVLYQYKKKDYKKANLAIQNLEINRFNINLRVKILRVLIFIKTLFYAR